MTPHCRIRPMNHLEKGHLAALILRSHSPRYQGCPANPKDTSLWHWPDLCSPQFVHDRLTIQGALVVGTEAMASMHHPVRQGLD